MRGARKAGARPHEPHPHYPVAVDGSRLLSVHGILHSVVAMHRMHPWAILPLILLTASCAAPSSRDAETGDHLFTTYCAACHGANARGNGFANEYLKVAAPDLTLIAARRGGQFSAPEIYKIIDGQSGDDFYTHRHMPVWGYEFYGDEAEDQQAHQRASDRVNSLVTYLEHIQRYDPR